MIPVCLNDYSPLSGRLRAGSQRESGCFSLIFRHFPLVFLPGAWYNKVVIPQTLHQQQRERDESMSNTKILRRIIVGTVVFSLSANLLALEPKEINWNKLVELIPGFHLVFPPVPKNGEVPYNIGISFLESDPAKAMEYIRDAAERGYPPAQYQLGVCYSVGNGVKQDKTEAVKWYRKAAKKGFAWAQNNLGVCYSKGSGVKQDNTEAVKWFRKAAEQGFDMAQFNLGGCYVVGEGVERDKAEAVKWFRKAAKQGYAEAQFSLGVLYYIGAGVQPDKTKAVKWWHKASEQGHAASQFMMGYCFKAGIGVEANEEEAEKWFHKAADQGDRPAGKQPDMSKLVKAIENKDENTIWEIQESW